MSSILKALKKAEEQSPKLELPSDLLQKVDTKEVVSRRAKSARSYHRITITALVLIIAGFGTWFVLSPKEPSHPEQKDGKTILSPAPAREEPPSSPSRKETADTAVKAEKLSATEVKPEKPATPGMKTEKPTPEVKTEKLAERVKEKESPVVALNSGSGGNQAVEPPNPIRRATIPPPSSPPKESRESHPDASKFKLEAIVWAENESSRFAVINGQILRSGGSIDGLSILGVGKEHVSVRSKGRDWEMKFIAD